MILKSDRIADWLDRGAEPGNLDPLVITPRLERFEVAERRLRRRGSASIDLRLGTWFTSLRPSRMKFFNISGPVSQSQLAKTTYVPFGVEYVLHPGGFVLGVTLEWLRLPKEMAAYVIGKSSWGRRGLIIATATGVHPGFKGCLTLELSNVGEIPVVIKPGMAICQLFLHLVDGSGSQRTDRSRFAGSRKPTFGEIRPDAIADALADPGPEVQDPS